VGPRIPPHLPRPIAFAHRGARAHARENTLEAFELALRLGATGLESDVWLTRDGTPVLDHDGVVGGRLRRRAIGEVHRDDLPEHIPTLAQVFEDLGTDFHLSLDVKDPDAGAAAVEVASAADPTLPARLWMCDDDHQRLVELRAVSAHVRLVDSTRLRRIVEGPERRAAKLQELGIDALNLHHSDWSGGLTTLVHRFGLLAFGWDAQFDRTIHALVHMGADGVYSDHVDRLIDVLRHHGHHD
jgi:glycerophosphoryl diester phosphodiesterase